jgi:putative membrane protein
LSWKVFKVDFRVSVGQNASMNETKAHRTAKDPNLNDYLAAERTFLAWIRTGLALMGFGFVVARFGLFLQQVRLAEPGLSGRSYGLSIWFGTALIAAGVLVDIFSSWHHVRLVHQLNRGETEFTGPSRAAIVLASFLALVGIAMAIYLISV